MPTMNGPIVIVDAIARLAEAAFAAR